MATFVTLMTWTDQGSRDIRDWGRRVGAAEDLVKKLGGQLKDVFITLGQYDVVAVVDAPDDETATQISLAIGSQGNAKIQTLRAFPRTQAETLIAKTFK